GSKPYGAEYELEMQILQWTGRPRMALINLIGADDHQREWRQALDQYFSLVRVFDAVAADFDTRVALLKVFGELDDEWRAPLDRAVAALVVERDRRRRRSAAEIAACLIDSLQLVERLSLDDDEPMQPAQQRMMERLQKRLRSRERQCREAVQGLYRHQALEWQEGSQSLLDTDLFTHDGWELFGLSRQKLVVSGALTGALAGGGIDALLAGASLALGAGIGALIGGASAWFGSGELARIKVLGETIGGRIVQVGPVKAGNFPWVLLGRAWVHHQLVAERNHAYREVISLALQSDQNLMDGLPDELRKELQKVFALLFKSGASGDVRGSLIGLVDRVLDNPLAR
ncbi:MAG: DUF3482 domain-containing protein, partial [Pseudomonadales bacterium]